MINISDKRNCCGCTACSQVCPKSCITMQIDEEGFKYPQVDANLCVDCGLCEKVCPYLNSYPIPEEKPASFACKTKDDDLRGKALQVVCFRYLLRKSFRRMEWCLVRDSMRIGMFTMIILRPRQDLLSSVVQNMFRAIWVIALLR